MRSLVFAVAASLMAGGGAVAEEGGQFYLGAGYATLDYRGDDFGTVSLLGGYRFSDRFGIEGEARLGLDGLEDTSRLAVALVTSDRALDHAASVFLRGDLPVGETFVVFGRAGFSWWKIDDANGPVKRSINEDGFAYGLGAEWAFAGPNAVRLDYTRYDFDGGESDGYGVSYVRRF